ncbi:hypothetical protein SD77_1320 [Bacillus badius]|uniref:Ribose 5-phosphate isomerase B n=1 Tax=Bacillus badius TaxID=1455 RepID=A0ABR5ASB3_BACBA|nr:hypothetical protein SD77_1320 [Bacillus badius]
MTHFLGRSFFLMFFCLRLILRKKRAFPSRPSFGHMEDSLFY